MATDGKAVVPHGGLPNATRCLPPLHNVPGGGRGLGHVNGKGCWWGRRPWGNVGTLQPCCWLSSCRADFRLCDRAGGPCSEPSAPCWVHTSVLRGAAGCCWLSQLIRPLLCLARAGSHQLPAPEEWSQQVKAHGFSPAQPSPCWVPHGPTRAPGQEMLEESRAEVRAGGADLPPWGPRGPGPPRCNTRPAWEPLAVGAAVLVGVAVCPCPLSACPPGGFTRPRLPEQPGEPGRGEAVLAARKPSLRRIPVPSTGSGRSRLC